jgi:predicted transposase/invertase (TIGR01784 family)
MQGGVPMATKLKYAFKNDILFKMLFVRHPDLLKRLGVVLLGIGYESIGQFEITNPEILPESPGEKLCRLDINMTVDGRRLDLEIQVKDGHDFPERSLFYWAREYSSALGKGREYIELPQAVIISITAFKLFDCTEFHSEYQALEVTRHTRLTDRMSLHYFELPKLPETVRVEDELQLWLKLFDAETEEELQRIEATEVTVMTQAIEAYRSITATEEFQRLERMRFDAACNEASALGNARREEREKWQGVVAGLQDTVAEKDTRIAEKDTRIAEKDTRIAELEAQIAKLGKNNE